MADQRNSILCVLLVVLLTLGGCQTTVSHSAGAVPLFELQPTPARDALKASATGRLATLLEDPATEQVTFIQVNAQMLVGKPKSLSVSLPDGKAVQFDQRSAGRIFENIEGWVGARPNPWKTESASAAEVADDPLYYLSVASSGDKISADLVIEGQPYRIEPLDGTQHALVKIDEDKLLPDGEPVRRPDDEGPQSAAIQAPSAEQSVIRVLLVTTNQLRQKYPDHRLKLAGALQNANQYMVNSDVAITYQLAGFFDADYDERPGMGSMLSDMWEDESALGTSIRVRRDAVRADLVNMTVATSGTEGYCGLGQTNASKTSAFSVIYCYASLAHELGHNMGASHNNEGEYATYYYGYRREAEPRFRTRMSYSCLNVSCPQIPYWSNPRLEYQGTPMGTVAYNDVARRFNERRAVVENFYPSMPTTVTLFQEENLQGRSCSMQLRAPFDDKSCQTGVRSAQVHGVDVNATLCFSGHNLRGACYIFERFSGDFDISNIDEPADLPAGIRKVINRTQGEVLSIKYFK